MNKSPVWEILPRYVPSTVNTSVIYCNLRSGLSTLELNEYCICWSGGNRVKVLHK